MARFGAGLDGGERARPVRPRSGRNGHAGAVEQIAPVEQEPRIDIPRDTVHRARDAIRIPDPAEEIARIHRGSCKGGIEGFECAERHEFRNPRVAELANVGRGVAGERRQQLFVGRGPWQLLDGDANARMRALELREECSHHFALPSHCPEADDGDVGRALAAADQARAHGEKRREQTATAGAAGHCTVAVSQPPVKPARSRPRRTYGFSRITFQMSPLR